MNNLGLIALIFSIRKRDWWNQLKQGLEPKSKLKVNWKTYYKYNK